ncbi:MAG: stage V sporulation T C-terminal domain-containing protein [Massiliimalia sp.]
MKATGIVRRIDDLGRVVIPKEIRRTMRIREGDPLEIFTSPDGDVVFKKYSPVGEMSHFAAEYADVLYKTGEAPVLVCDKDHVIAAAGIPKREVVDRRVSVALEDLMNLRKNAVYSGSEGEQLRPVEGLDRYVLACQPIISSSDVCGAVMFINSEKVVAAKETQVKLVESAALFMGRQMEG